MTTLLASLSHVELVELVIDLQGKLLVNQNILNEQLSYVTELEEGVRNLAEQLEKQTSTLLFQSKELSRLQLENDQVESKWTQQLRSIEIAHQLEIEKFNNRLTALEKENASYDQLIEEMEDVLNSQQSKILDLQARVGTKLEESLIDIDPLDCSGMVDLSFLSNDTVDDLQSEEEEDDEELSPVDLKINRDLSARKMSQLRRSESQVDENSMEKSAIAITCPGSKIPSNVEKGIIFRSVNTINADEPVSLSAASSGKKPIPVRENTFYNDNIPIPPLPPPSPLSKLDRSSISKARESRLQAMTAPIPQLSIASIPPTVSSASWKDAKKHDSLFQQVSLINNEEDNKEAMPTKQYYHWYIEGEDESS